MFPPVQRGLHAFAVDITFMRMTFVTPPNVTTSKHRIKRCSANIENSLVIVISKHDFE